MNAPAEVSRVDVLRLNAIHTAACDKARYCLDLGDDAIPYLGGNSIEAHTAAVSEYRDLIARLTAEQEAKS